MFAFAHSIYCTCTYSTLLPYSFFSGCISLKSMLYTMYVMPMYSGFRSKVHNDDLFLWRTMLGIEYCPLERKYAGVHLSADQLANSPDKLSVLWDPAGPKATEYLDSIHGFFIWALYPRFEERSGVSSPYTGYGHKKKVLQIRSYQTSALLNCPMGLSILHLELDPKTHWWLQNQPHRP